MIPPEYQDALEFFSKIPFYVRLITISSVVSVVVTLLVGVGVIVQLNRLIGALRTSRGAIPPSPFSTASSTTSAGPAPQYGSGGTTPYGTTPHGSAGPYGQSGQSGQTGQSGQSPWGS